MKLSRRCANSAKRQRLGARFARFRLPGGRGVGPPLAREMSMEFPSLTVEDIMSTPLVSLEDDLSLFLADWLMREKHVRHIPVLDRDRHVLGLVTHRTLLAAKHSDPNPERAVLISEIMIKNPMCLGRDETAAAAARFMVENQLGCAIIVDENLGAVGMVTESDFIELAAKLLFQSPRIAVDDFMTTDVITLTESEPVVIADELLRAGRFRHLPVVDAVGRLTGLVTHRDLLSTHFGPDNRRTAGAIATRDVWTINSGSSARNAARMLADHRFGCLPVVDQGLLVGLITEADVVMLLVRLLTKAGAFGKTEMPTRITMSSPVHCVGLDTPLEEARAQMSRRTISSLGVVSDRNHLVGIVTATDLVRDGNEGDIDVVSERMTRDVVTVDISAPIAKVADTIVAEAIHRAFVVDEGRLVGVVSVNDLVRVVRDMRVHMPLSELMSPMVMTIGAGEPIEAATRFLDTAQLHALIVLEAGWPIGILSQRRRLEKPSAIVVEDAISGCVVCMPESTPAFRAAAQMAELGVEHVVCLRGGEPSGVVTSFDMARCCARFRTPRER